MGEISAIMRFSERLKVLRKELGLTQDDLAKSCDVQLTAISKYETEVVKPSFEMLSRLGLVYNVNLNWLVNEMGSMFIEAAHKRLIKNGTEVFAIEVIENMEKKNIINDVSHSLDLTNDVKVEYFDANDKNYTKIYHRNGEIEYEGKNQLERNLEYILQKIQNFSDRK